MADYEGMDEAQLKQLLDNASNYDERSSIRKALRKLKGSDSKKKVGSANYRRAGYQAPTTMAIPNSVTGNILPNRVNTENLGKVEVPNTKATISYLKNRSQTVSSPRTDSSGGRHSTSSPVSAASPRGSVSSCMSDLSGRNDQEDVEGERSSSVTGGRTPSPMALASKTRVNGVSSPVAPPPSKEVSPPPREPTPPPPREPTPPPPKEPTPPPPREPTPPPPKEPTPPPPREPTPEEEPEVEEEEVEEEVEVEEEEEEEEEEEDDEQEHTEGVKVNYDSEDDEEDDRRKRTYSPSQEHDYRASRSTGGVAAKAVVPLDVLTKKEEGIDGGDFRNKLQKANNTKIDTTSAFPQARPKGEQVDFRNVLKKKDTAKVDTAAAFPQAKTKGEQVDFRNVLKKTDKKEPIPSPKPSRSRRVGEEPEASSEEPVERENSASPETAPNEETEEVQEEEEAEAEQEEEELQVSKEEEEEKEVENQQEDAVDGSSPADQQSGGRGSAGGGEVEEDSYEARQAERRRRREQRQRELAAITDDKSSEKASTKESSKSDTSSSTTSSGTGELDSYEARREARRKAREERLKAASEGGTKMTYKEKKALEARKNAKESRNKWESREEDSGAKKEAKPANFKKKDSATQQLLAWCQHKTKFYENVDIRDFRTSWSDGLAFCAIMHSFLPDKIPYDDLTPEDKRKNFTLAFEAAKDAGIPEMLDVDDMLMVKIPDSKSIMTFLVTIYQHFNS